MKRLLLVLILAYGCSKKEEAAPSSTPAPSAAPVASSAAPAVEKPSERAIFKGSYAAKQAEVRTPSDAPSFIHPESKDGIGNGELELTVSGKEVTGKGTGALGAQTFSGWLEDGRLTGTLHPSDGGASAMWGVVDATVEGSTIKGVVRGSGRDGRVVREASFTLEKKG